MVQRKDTWRSDLSTYIHAVSRTPFAWGEHDCAIFAAGAVKAMTGEDFAAEHRGRYSTARGAARHLKKAGHADLAELVASIFEEIPVAFAQVGDIAVVPIEDGQALGVVQGDRIYVVRPGEDGIGTVGLLEATRAFKV